MKRKVSDLVQILELQAPSSTAENWDNVGLLAGDPRWETHGAVVSIDLTEEALEIAQKKGFRLIVNHHPCIFPAERGLSRLLPQNLAFVAIREGIAIASYHTNFDRCALEVVYEVSNGLGIKPCGRLIEKAEQWLKLSVFVPLTHLETVRNALCEAGAGQIGNYDFCTFSTEGEGSFRGREGAHPFVGQVGKLEMVREARLETILPYNLQDSVLKALFVAHPYEEVAYDLYPLAQQLPQKSILKGIGYGFWGEFELPRSFSDLAQDVKKLFQIEGFWVTNSSSQQKQIKRIAFVAGKGSSFLKAALSLESDVLVTGEVGYHEMLEAQRHGMAVIELGHRESERFFLTTVSEWLTREGIEAVQIHTPTQKIWRMNS